MRRVRHRRTVCPAGGLLADNGRRVSVEAPDDVADGLGLELREQGRGARGHSVAQRRRRGRAQQRAVERLDSSGHVVARHLDKRLRMEAPSGAVETKKWTRVAHKASSCSGAAVARYRDAADGWEGRAREVEKFVSFAVVWQVCYKQLGLVDYLATALRLVWKGSGRTASARCTQRCHGPK